MTAFQPDPAFEAGSIFATDWPLCHVRLQDDARFPWLILIPRRDSAKEIEHLSPSDRTALTEEIVRAGRLIRAATLSLGHPIDKLNVGAIGNVTAQLHVHVVGRRHDDDLWPAPVWGRGPATPYDNETRAGMLKLINTF